MQTNTTAIRAQGFVDQIINVDTEVFLEARRDGKLDDLMKKYWKELQLSVVFLEVHNGE